MDLSPEQRGALLAFRARCRQQQSHLDSLAANIETALMREEATELAISERLGRPAKDGDAITPQDDHRAAEIVANCWLGFE